jgi:hypothetical protein
VFEDADLKGYVQTSFGDTQLVSILIWWYAGGFEYDLGVREYQKVENRCFTGFN